MSLPALVAKKLSTEFKQDIALNPGSRVLCDYGDAADFVDLYIYPKERYKGMEWELLLIVETKDGVVTTGGVGIHAASTPGGSYVHLGNPDKPDGQAFPAEILAIAADMTSRVAALRLPLLTLEKRERGLFDAILEIAKAKSSGDEDALVEAISAAISRIVEIDPSVYEELEEAPAPSMTR